MYPNYRHSEVDQLREPLPLPKPLKFPLNPQLGSSLSSSYGPTRLGSSSQSSTTATVVDVDEDDLISVLLSLSFEARQQVILKNPQLYKFRYLLN